MTGGDTSEIPISMRLILAIGFVAVNAFFVTAEFALVKVRDTQIQPLAGRGSRRARMVRRLLSNLDPYLSACQLGVTLASLALGWVGEPVAAGLLSPIFDGVGLLSPHWRHGLAVAFGFTLITFVHIVIGEQAPKFIAIKRVVPAALWIAFPLDLFFRATYPFIWVLNVASMWVLRRLGIETASHHGAEHTEEELRLVLGGSLQQGNEPPVARDIVLNALDLRRRRVRDVMRPRRDIVCLNTFASIGESLALAEQMRYSRYPLAENGDVDRAVGAVHIKDLYAARNRVATAGDLRPYARKLIYVPETARLAKLLDRFLEKKIHLALVVDEYGAVVGMLTLENILEEIVGQIQDEFDHEKARIEKLSDREFVIEGSLPLFELSELIQEPLVADDASTVSGWMTERLGGFPKVGDAVSAGKSEVRVLELDGLRVAKLRVTKPEEKPPEPNL